jgi:DNA repair exonuclease SbcCD ATPase subunit
MDLVTDKGFISELASIAEDAKKKQKAQLYLEQRQAILTQNISEAASRLEAAEKARLVIQEVAKTVQQNLEFHIENIVSSALDAVFPDPIKFVVKFEARRGKSECDLLFEEDGNQYSPLDDSSFGSVDVASCTLRLAVWCLDKNRPTIIMDEPFRHVSPDLQHKVSDMIKSISDRLGVQIIMVSHAEDINVAADRIFNVEKVGGESRVIQE